MLTRGMRRNKLLSMLKERIADGTDKPCITGNVLKDPEAKLNDGMLLQEKFHDNHSVKTNINVLQLKSCPSALVWSLLDLTPCRAI